MNSYEFSIGYNNEPFKPLTNITNRKHVILFLTCVISMIFCNVGQFIRGHMSTINGRPTSRMN